MHRLNSGLDNGDLKPSLILDDITAALQNYPFTEEERKLVTLDKDKAFKATGKGTGLGIDALRERIGKITVLAACLLLANNGDSGLSNETTNDLVWTINDFVAEVEELLGTLELSQTKRLISCLSGFEEKCKKRESR